jgi:hypothetical protein
LDLDQRVEATSFRYLVDIGIIPVLGSVGGSILVAASQIELARFILKWPYG